MRDSIVYKYNLEEIQVIIRKLQFEKSYPLKIIRLQCRSIYRVHAIYVKCKNWAVFAMILVTNTPFRKHNDMDIFFSSVDLRCKRMMDSWCGAPTTFVRALYLVHGARQAPCRRWYERCPSSRDIHHPCTSFSSFQVTVDHACVLCCRDGDGRRSMHVSVCVCVCTCLHRHCTAHDSWQMGSHRSDVRLLFLLPVRPGPGPGRLHAYAWDRRLSNGDRSIHRHLSLRVAYVCNAGVYICSGMMARGPSSSS